MFNFIRSIFGYYKAKSLEEFVEVLERERKDRGVAITVKPYTKFKGICISIDNANVQLMLKFTGIMSCGRKVVYKRRGAFLKTSRNSHYKQTKGKAYLKNFMIGEQKVIELREKFPGVSVNLIFEKMEVEFHSDRSLKSFGFAEQVMDSNLFSKLHKEAAGYGLFIHDVLEEN